MVAPRDNWEPLYKLVEIGDHSASAEEPEAERDIDPEALRTIRSCSRSSNDRRTNLSSDSAQDSTTNLGRSTFLNAKFNVGWEQVNLAEKRDSRLSSRPASWPKS